MDDQGAEGAVQLVEAGGNVRESELKRRIQAAEKSGNLEEALQLASELKKRSGRNSSG